MRLLKASAPAPGPLHCHHWRSLVDASYARRLSSAFAFTTFASLVLSSYTGTISQVLANRSCSSWICRPLFLNAASDSASVSTALYVFCVAPICTLIVWQIIATSAPACKLNTAPLCEVSIFLSNRLYLEAVRHRLTITLLNPN